MTFNPIKKGMGIGKIGTDKVSFTHKMRWTFKATFPDVELTEAIVKLSARPNITEETEMNFLSNKTWIPGKATWESITITYYGVEPEGDFMKKLSTIIEHSFKKDGKRKKNYLGSGELVMYDGCGAMLEQWKLDGIGLHAINFGDLGSDGSEVELTMRYAKVKYVHIDSKLDLTPPTIEVPPKGKIDITINKKDKED